jgi:hypothetical protein
MLSGAKSLYMVKKIKGNQSQSQEQLVLKHAIAGDWQISGLWPAGSGCRHQ